MEEQRRCTAHSHFFPASESCPWCDINRLTEELENSRGNELVLSEAMDPLEARADAAEARCVELFTENERLVEQTERERGQAKEIIKEITTLRAKLVAERDLFTGASDRLVAKLAAAQEDTARLDWLGDSKPIVWVERTTENGAWEIYHQYKGRIGGPGPLRASIDDARKVE